MLSGNFFHKVLFKEYSKINMDKVFSNLLTNNTIRAAFPNLVTLASLAITLPVTTATLERSFSDMKFIKTRLRNRLGKETLDQTMRICIEGPDILNDDGLKDIVAHCKGKKSRLLLKQCTTYNTCISALFFVVVFLIHFLSLLSSFPSIFF